MIIDNEHKLRVATVFSGIGSPEFALKRMGIPHEIVFACDNGEIDMLLSDDEIAEQLKKIKTLKARKKYVSDQINPRKVNYVKKSYLANYQMDEKYHHAVEDKQNPCPSVLMGRGVFYTFSSFSLFLLRCIFC